MSHISAKHLYLDYYIKKLSKFNSRENKQSRQKMGKRHCNRRHNGPNRHQVLTVESVNVSSFGNRVFADGIKLKDVELGRLSWIIW